LPFKVRTVQPVLRDWDMNTPRSALYRTETLHVKHFGMSDDLLGLLSVNRIIHVPANR
jgi:hypothetical protein